MSFRAVDSLCMPDSSISGHCTVLKANVLQCRCILPDDYAEPECAGKVLQGKACDDFNPCTKDSVCVMNRFLEQPGEIGVAFCKGVLNPTATCTDYDPCTINDRCEEQIESKARCVGDSVVNVSCDDGQECTTNDVCSFSQDYGFPICGGEFVDGCEEPYDYNGAETPSK